MRKDFSPLFSALDSADESSAVSIIVKLTGETCNINCFYCYEKRKPYENAQVLDIAVFAGWLDRLGNQPLAIELHGGEPLLFGQKRMRALLQHLQTRRNIVRLSLQTNGTLLDDAWLDLFDELAPTLELGISLDGDLEANSLRVDYKDQSSFEKVKAALEQCKIRHRRCGVIAVVSSANVNRPEVTIDFFAEFECIKALSFVPCFDYAIQPKTIPLANVSRLLPLLATPENPKPGWAITPTQYLEFLRTATDVWIHKRYFHNFLLEPVMSVVRRLEGRHTTSCHFTSQKCSHVLTLYPDGRVGSCDELPMPDSLLSQSANANLSQIAESINQSPLFDQLKQLMTKCEVCDYRLTCGGGCLATRLRFKDTRFDDDYCNYRIGLINHVSRCVTKTSEGE